MTRLRARNLCRCGVRPGGYSPDHSSLRCDVRQQVLVPARVGVIRGAVQHGDGPATRHQGPVVGGGVDAVGSLSGPALLIADDFVRSL
jgi:hypothetical protein